MAPGGKFRLISSRSSATSPASIRRSDRSWKSLQALNVGFGSTAAHPDPVPRVPLSRPEPTSIFGTARDCAEFGCPGPRVSRCETIATSSASYLVRQHLWLSIGVIHKQEWLSSPAHSVSIASESPKTRLRAGCGAVLCDSAAPKSCPAGGPKVSRQPCCEAHGIHIAE
jgi:hypothetical protein